MEDFGRVLHGYFVGKDIVAEELESVDVVFVFCNLTDGFVGDVEGKDFIHATVHDNSYELCIVVAPTDAADTIVEVGSVVGAVAGFEVENHEAEFVALIAVMFHALPSNFLSIVAEDWVLVVAHDAFADVDSGAVGNVVDENVTVGAESIVFAGFGSAGVGYAGAVGREVELFDATPRTHGTLEGFGADDVDSVAYLNRFGGEVGEIDVGVFVDPVVPVTVHEVFVDATGSFVQAMVEFLNVFGTLDRYVADVNDFVTFGRDFETFKSALDGSEKLFGLALDVHGDDVVATSEEDGFVVEPDGVELVFDGVGETNSLSITRGGDEIDFGVAFVTFDAVVGVSVDDLRAVGANIVFAHFAKLPHNFGGETAVLDGDVGFADDGFIDQLTAIATHGEQECC